MADDVDEASGPDAGVDQFNLNPGFGNDPSRPIRLIPTAAQAIYPESTSALLSPVSITQTPRGGETKPILAAPGQPVDLLPQRANLVPTPTVAPVVPASDVAPQPRGVQVAQATSPNAQIVSPAQGGPGEVAPIPRQPLLPGAPSPGHGRGLFGSNVPIYPKFDPNADPLVTLKGKLQGDADFLQGQINRPNMKFFYGNTVEKMGAELEEKLKAIADVNKQLQEQKNNQIKADNSGIPRNQQTWSQNNDTIVENLVQRYRSGDTTAGDALKARGLTALTTSYQTDHVAALESKLEQGTKIKNLLDSAVTDKDYDRFKKQLDDGTHELSHPDFQVPKTLGEWQSQRAVRDKNAREAALTIEKYHQTVAQQQNFTNQTDKDKAAIQVGNLKMSNGEQMPGTTAKVHAGIGVDGVEDVNGSHDMTKFGADKGVEGTWGNYGKEQGKIVGEEMELAFPKSEREKAISFNRIYEGATHDKKGNLLPAGQVNTNPNMQQGIAEGLASILRGGAGGANSQLMKLELAKRGIAQNTIDYLIANFSGIKGVLTGKEGQYLSKLSQSQVREVMDFIKVYNDRDVAGRLQGVAEHLGRYGGRLDQSPIEEELRDNSGLKAAQARGRDAEKFHRSQIPAIVTDHSRIYLDNGPAGMTVPGATRQPLPPSMLPGLYPELQIQTPPAAPPAAIPPPAGGGVAVPPPPVRVIPGATGGPAAAAPGTDFFGFRRAPNMRAGGSVAPAPAPAPAPAVPAPQPAGGNPFTGGATPIPFTPGAPATVAPGGAGGGLRPLAATPAASVIQSLAGRPAAPVQAAQAQLPAAWGAGVGGVPAAAPAARPAAPPPPSVPTPQQPGGVGTGAATPPPAVAAPKGTRPSNTYDNGVPSGGFPAHIASNPVARTVFGVAGQTAQNVTAGNPNSATISNNSAIVATSSAASESGFRPNEIHDGGIGYGLYGHNGDRLAAMHQFAGTQRGQPIPVNAQTSFYVREMSKAADVDPFIAQVLNNPNASAEDLTRVQVRLEKPQGYKGPGTEEKASGWANRLASTREMLGGAGGPNVPATAVAATQPVNVPYPNPKSPQEARANYAAGQRQTPEEAAQYQQLRQQRLESATASGAHMAPAVLGAAGGVVGSAVPGVGTVAGSAVGGAAGGAIENYFTGGQENQNPAGYIQAGGWGAAKAAAGAVGGPGVGGMAARTVLSGAVPAAEAAVKGKDAGEIYDAGLWGAAGGALGEAVGRGLGQAGHLLWGGYSTATKDELLGIAKVLSEQKPKQFNAATGKLEENIHYTNAAERAKQLGQEPEALAYSYNTAVKDVASGQRIPPSKKEAIVNRPSGVAQIKAGDELDQVRGQVQEAGAAKMTAANVPAGTQFKAQFKHDPTTIVGSKEVPNDPKYVQAASIARDTMNAKAGNWKEIWNNNVDARATLLEKSRKAEAAAPYPDQAQDVKAFRALADKVRQQQEHISQTLLPPAQSKALMEHLQQADIHYRDAMRAGGEDIVKTIAAGGQKGREAQAAFNGLVGNDPEAQHMMASLLKLHSKTAAAKAGGGYVGAGVLGTAAYGLLPHGHVIASGIGLYKGYHALRDFMTLKGSGSPATFKDLVNKRISVQGQMRKARVGAQVGAGALPAAIPAMSGDEATAQ